MIKKQIKKGLYILALFLQCICLAGVSILQSLTTKKAGVMHHLYYRRYQYEASYLSPENLEKAMILAMILGLFVMGVTLGLALKRQRKSVIFQWGLLAAMLMGLSYSFKSEALKQFLAYPYFLMAFGWVILIQGIVAMGNQIIKSNEEAVR